MKIDGGGVDDEEADGEGWDTSKDKRYRRIGELKAHLYVDGMRHVDCVIAYTVSYVIGYIGEAS